jgi:SpoVK/Ycf46/Vps4 family AAA+-type ATPase
MCSWILRIYGGHGGMPAFREGGNPALRAVADILGLAPLADQTSSAATVQALLAEKSREILDPLQGDSDAGTRPYANWPVLDSPMRGTMQWLAQSAGLNAVEYAIFELTVVMRVFRALQKAAESWGELNQGDLPYALSALLNIPLPDILAVWHPKGALLSCGVVRINQHADEYLNAMLLVPRQLAESIAYHQGPPQGILAHLAEPLRKPTLGLEDFAHIRHHTGLAQSWLAGVLLASQSGEVAGHMLVSGAPGLGKTEWARALLMSANTQTLEMVVLDQRGRALTGEDRMQHLRMLLLMMRSTSRGVILFDEADDVFQPPSAALGGRSGESESVSMDNHRAALNHLMESSRIPVVWVMNRPEVLDPAVLRRFDVHVQFEGVPRSVRLALIVKRFGQRTTSTDPTVEARSEAELERWAQVQTLTPTLIDRLARVSERALAADLAMDDTLCRHWLRQRLPGKPTRHLQVRENSDTSTTTAFEPLVWTPDAVNASVDLMGLVDGIRKTGSARIALCGAPGTGKTAFAHALARMLDKPLLEQRASDLLSAYVGETEQRIRAAFEQAQDEEAVLFIDEVDGLLARREHAARTWEVTQVNELLEQLGEYQGVVVVATNRLEAIDPAALRRFDMKIVFEALQPEQVKAGFIALCNAHQISCGDSELARVGSISGVTPGDFACIARRMRFAPDLTTATHLIELLQAELALKAPVRQPMGFVIPGTTGDSATGV